MAAPEPPVRVQPCPVCGGRCGRFPDLPSDKRNPFLGATAEDMKALHEPEPKPKTRPKGKRRPAEDRARRLEEDR